MMNHRAAGAVALAAVLALAGCGDASGGQNASAGTIAAPGSSPLSSTGAATSGPAISGAGATTDTTATPDGSTVTLAVTNDPSAPRYSQGVLSAPVGSKLLIEYNNPSQEPHNWVLVEPGQEQAVVDAAAATNGDPSNVAGVLAYSPTISGSTVAVDVPPLTQAGGYVYLCTVPGHYAAGHKGALNVQ